MPIGNVIRVSVLGAMPSGEVWSVNPVFQLGGVSTSEDLTVAQVQEMATAVAAIGVPAQLMGCLSTSSTVTGCRLELRRWNGDLAAQAEGIKATPQAGLGTTYHPYQTSVVVSLRTAGYGGRKRGRLYWPLTGLALSGSNLRIDASATNSVVTGMKTYLTSITTALEATAVNDVHLAVWSRTSESTEWVTSLQVGDVADTQRRRRDALIESTTATSYP